MYRNLDENRKHMYEIKMYFITELLKIEDVTINAVNYDKERKIVTREAIEATAPHVVSASFADVRSEVLLHALEGNRITSYNVCYTKLLRAGMDFALRVGR